MKNVYQILSDRGGYYHNLVKYDETHYVFLPAEDWMGIYVSGNEEEKDKFWIDANGGPCMGVGWCNDEITVEHIETINGRPMFTIKENSKD